MRAIWIAAGVLGAALLAGAARAEEPPSPFQSPSPKSAHKRWGCAILSDDTRVDGLVSTTPGKPIRIFDRKKSTYRDIAFAKIERVEQAPDREWLEQEWRWLEGGNDRKVFTNRFYRAAKYRTTLTLKSGEKIVGDVVAPIRVTAGKKRHLFELRKRVKSPQPAPKDELKPLAYLKTLVLTDTLPEEASAVR